MPTTSTPPPTKQMSDWTIITHYAGFDWAKNQHDIIIVDRTGQIVADFQIEHSGPGWQSWRERIAAYPGLAVAIETNQGAAIEQLLASHCTLYPVQPKSAQRYRERKVPSGNKTDRLDAWSLADALRVDGHGWKPLAPQDPLLAELRLLCRDEVALIEERTALINQLQQALYEYYPTALEAFTDWSSPAAWAFVEAFPAPELCAKPASAAGRSSSMRTNSFGLRPPPRAWRVLHGQASLAPVWPSPAPRAAWP